MDPGAPSSSTGKATPPTNQGPPPKKAKTTPATISSKELQTYNIFRFLPKCKLLQTAKLAYVFTNTAVIVTTEDDTYSIGLVGGTEKPTTELTKVPQLCGKNIKDFISGSDQDCFALTTSGEIYSWGTPQSELSESLLPIKVGGGVDGKAIVQVAAFSTFALALDSDGFVYSWGNNAKGQLGLGTTIEKSAPTPIPAKWFKQKIVVIAVSENMSAALSETGQLFKWGHGVTKPKMVTCGIPFKKIISGLKHVHGLSDKGIVYRIGQGELKEAYVGPGRGTLDVGADVKVKMSAYKTEHVIEINGRIGGGDAGVRRTSHFSSMDQAFAALAQITFRTLRPDENTSTIHTQHNSLSQDVAKAWDEKTNYDVTFRVEKKMIQAHKCILRLRSEYFDSMFNEKWKEASDVVIDVQDTEFSAFQSLLYHMYHDEFDFEDANCTEAAKLMKLADTYCEFGIRGKCEKLLIRNVHANNVLYLLKIAATANGSELEKCCINFILDRGPSFAKSLGDPTKVLGYDVHKKLTLAALNRLCS